MALFLVCFFLSIKLKLFFSLPLVKNNVGYLVAGSGGRRIILENGNMVIKPVSRDDEGAYSCSAENRYGRDESYGRLIVMRKC